MITNKMTATIVPHHQSSKIFDLRSSGLLAKWPIVGLLMFLFGSLMFGALTYNLLTHGPLLQWDIAIANTWPAIALSSPAFIKYIMIAGFYIGKTGATLVALFLAVYSLYRKFWQEFAMAIIGWGGYVVLFNLFSYLLARPRPPTQIWIIVNLPGFPSGHGIAAVVCFGLVGYLLAPKMPSLFWKTFVTVATVLLILFIGFSRIFTGGHYLTDILAGYAVGIAWFGVAYTLIEMYYHSHRVPG